MSFLEANIEIGALKDLYLLFPGVEKNPFAIKIRFYQKVDCVYGDESLESDQNLRLHKITKETKSSIWLSFTHFARNKIQI